jgi:6-phosphogluconolactonase (cycloisomerase 2 family)
METNWRMSKRFAWLFAMMALVSIGLLVACGSTYNPASDGLVLVTSQGSALLETFSFSLNSGSTAAIYNSPSSPGTPLTCVLNGIPSAIVVDPAGTYAYTIITANQSECGSNSTTTGIGAFQINSDGTMKVVGSLVPDPNPIALVMDSKGKYLFVAEGLKSTVNSYAIGSGATLTAVPGTFTLSLPMNFQAPNLAAIAATPRVFPALVNDVQLAACSNQAAPTAEYLYAADSANNVVWEFSVDTSTGALGNPPSTSQVPYFPSPMKPTTGQSLSVPSGVAVDACDRFVYVANNATNDISAYTICTSVTQSCQTADGSLLAVSGSPFTLGSSAYPGPLMTDPYGNYLYVLDGWNQPYGGQVSIFRISPFSGSLTAGTPAAAVSTGLGPTSLAIRSDGNWLFVANFKAATLSQYSITPDTGALTPFPVTSTDNYPWGVAVK